MPNFVQGGPENRDRSERSALVVEVMGRVDEYVALFSHDKRLLAVNQSFCKAMGVDEDQLVGRTLAELRPDLGKSVFTAALQATFERRVPTKRLGYSELSGSWVSVRTYPVDEGVLICASEASAAHAGELESVMGTHSDTLTSLPNRLAFDGDAKIRVQAGKPFTLAFIDLDRFKEVNDTYGHREGDRVLARLAASMKMSLGEVDDRLYRLAGDEFVALIDATGAEAERRLVALKESASTPVNVGVTEFTLGATVGYAEFPDQGETVDELLRRADIAMYEGKKSVDRRVRRFESFHEEAIMRRNRMSTGLTRAIRNNELFVMYQPQADKDYMLVSGLEALVRWNHPDFGVMAPDSFLPIAAEAGLMPAVDRWVTLRVIHDLPQLVAHGFKGKVAVNLSAESLSVPSFAEELLLSVKEHPELIPHLEFEITESAAVKDLEASKSTIQTLRENGLSVALDDFGTGYSSFEYLLSFPVDVAKIDRAFIKNLTTDLRSARLVRGMIQLLHSLGLSVVAEGVEIDQHRETLQLMGCDTLQGFLFSQPMELDKVLDFISDKGVFSKANWIDML